MPRCSRKRTFFGGAEIQDGDTIYFADDTDADPPVAVRVALGRKPGDGEMHIDDLRKIMADMAAGSDTYPYRGKVLVSVGGPGAPSAMEVDPAVARSSKRSRDPKAVGAFVSAVGESHGADAAARQAARTLRGLHARSRDGESRARSRATLSEIEKHLPDGYLEFYLAFADDAGHLDRVLGLTRATGSRHAGLSEKERIRGQEYVFSTLYPDLAFSREQLADALSAANNPSVPPAVLELLAGDKDPEVRLAVSRNPSTLPAVLESLAGDEDERVRRGVTENPSAPPDVLERLAADKDERVRYLVAENPSVPPAALERLAGDEYKYVRYLVAENPSTPSDALERMAGDEDERVRRLVARNPSAPPAALERLAADEDERVRLDVAENPSAPPDVLERLAGDWSSYVSLGVAENPSAPPDVLERLAGAYARRGVARNPSVPYDVLERLAGDKDERVRLAVSRNPSVPSDVLERLAADKHVYVRRGVAENPSVPPDALESLAGDEDALVRRAVSRNPSTPPDVLSALAADEDEFVRASAADNPSVPPAVLERLAADEDERVRLDVAENPSVPPDALERLAADKHVYVRLAVSRNPSMPPNALYFLAADEDEFVRRGVALNPSTPPAVLERLAGDEDERVRASAADNPSTPPAALERLAGDKDSEVRAAVSRNPSAPPAALERLAGDERAFVRKSAAIHPSLPLPQMPQEVLSEVVRSLALDPRTPKQDLISMVSEEVMNGMRPEGLYAARSAARSLAAREGWAAAAVSEPAGAALCPEAATELAPAVWMGLVDGHRRGQPPVVNLTPHEITIRDSEGRAQRAYLPSGDVARAQQKDVPLGTIGDIPVVRTTFGEPQGFPPQALDPEHPTRYIVSMITAKAAVAAGIDPGKLVLTSGVVLDSDKRIIGARQFATAPQTDGIRPGSGGASGSLPEAAAFPQGTQLINMTPRDISIFRPASPEATQELIAEIPASGVQAKASSTEAPAGELHGQPMVEVQFGGVSDLPPAQPGVAYVVSAIAAAAVRASSDPAQRDRQDLLVPSSPVRNAAGQIIGVTGLAVA